MPEFALPASPNWYCSRVSDCSENGILVYGARGSLNMFNIRAQPPKFCGSLLAHFDRLSSLSLCKHSGHLNSCCTSGDDSRIKIWDLDSKSLSKEYRYGKEGKVVAIEWSPCFKDLIIGGDDKGNIFCWNYMTNDVQFMKPENTAIFCLSCSPHEQNLIAVGYKSGVVLILDMEKQGSIAHRLRGHDEEIHSLCWCPIQGEDWLKQEDGDGEVNSNGCLLASGCRDRTIRLWSVSKGRCLQVHKIPANAGQRRQKHDEGSRSRIWLTLYWCQSQPEQIVSSSHSGELLLWNLTKPVKQKWQVFENGKGHSRIVFNICSAGPTLDDTLCTISMDRHIGIWSLKSLVCQHTIPTLGGFAYSVTASSLHPDKLAIGVGDDMIRIWSTGNDLNPYEASTLWQGVKAKVTALSWHPSREGILAYGTDDGRIGIHDVLSSKQPQISSTYHKKTVYVVCWGPACIECASLDKQSYVVYSCGDGRILQHDPKKMYDQEAKDMQACLSKTNQTSGRTKIYSEICWKPDFSTVAIGSDDGSVEIYKYPDMCLVCWVQVHRKLINCIRWHPEFTAATSQQSSRHCWIAIGSNETSVQVVDLREVLAAGTESYKDGSVPLYITNSVSCLEGHQNRITGLCWSPHNDAQLVSVSYDGTAQVWDVIANRAVANFRGHCGRLLCVQWSLLDPDIVYTGGEDFTLRSWKISQQENAMPPKGKPKKSKGKDKGKSKQHTSGQLQKDVKHTREPESVNNLEVDALQKMLEAKRQELLQKEPVASVNETSFERSDEQMLKEESSTLQEEETVPDATHVHMSAEEKADLLSDIVGFSVKPIISNVTESLEAKASDSAKKLGRKKRKDWKSLFPICGTLENKGKEQAYKDAEKLAAYIYENKPFPAEATHLCLFADRRAVYQMAQKEVQYHIEHGYIDGAIYLELWKGNLEEAVNLAKRYNCISDWLVAMTAQSGHVCYLQTCELYARQLESDSQLHKAASYLLTCHKIYEAIKLLQSHGLYREAIAIAKFRLSPKDTIIQDLFLSWARNLTKDGGYEQAIKCFITCQQPIEASKLLTKRGDVSGLKAAIFVCLSAGEVQEAKRHTLTALMKELENNDSREYMLWPDIQPRLEELDLKYFEIFRLMHGFICGELQILNLISKFTDTDLCTHLSKLIPCTEISEHSLYFLEGIYTVCEELFFKHTEQSTGIKNIDKALTDIRSYRQIQQGDLTLGQLLVEIGFDWTVGLLEMVLGKTTAIDYFLHSMTATYSTKNYGVLEGLCDLLVPEGADFSLNRIHQAVMARQEFSVTEDFFRIPQACNISSDISSDFSVIYAEDCIHAFDCWGTVHGLLAQNPLETIHFKQCLEKRWTVRKRNWQTMTIQDLQKYTKALLWDYVARKVKSLYGVQLQNDSPTVHQNGTNIQNGVTSEDNLGIGISGKGISENDHKHLETKGIVLLTSGDGNGTTQSRVLQFPDPVKSAQMIIQLCEKSKDSMLETEVVEQLKKDVAQWSLHYAYSSEQLQYFQTKLNGAEYENVESTCEQ